MKLLGSKTVTLIGAGAIGSFTALTLTKMGVRKLKVFDEDGISEHNLPNQFFYPENIGQFKVDALQEILFQFNGVQIQKSIRNYRHQKLAETVIVATDSMASRAWVWEQFLAQDQCLNLIEARMGAEVGMVYTIRKKSYWTTDGRQRFDFHRVKKPDRKFYEDRLYPDSKVEPLPCTARSIIYNVLMIASLISRSYKAIIMNEKYPREVIFNMTFVNDRSLIIRE